MLRDLFVTLKALAWFVFAGLVIVLLSGCASWSTTDRAIFTVNASCHAWDLRQTEWGLENGFIEGSPLLGNYPSDDELVAFKALAIGTSYAWGEYAPEQRTAILTTLTVLCAGIVAHNHSEGARP